MSNHSAYTATHEQIISLLERGIVVLRTDHTGHVTVLKYNGKQYKELTAPATDRNAETLASMFVMKDGNVPSTYRTLFGLRKPSHPSPTNGRFTTATEIPSTTPSQTYYASTRSIILNFTNPPNPQPTTSTTKYHSNPHQSHD